MHRIRFPHLRIPAGWLAVLPTLLILAAALVLTGEGNAVAATQPATPILSDALTLEQAQPTCQSCHPEQYKAWQGTTHAKATLDPVFQTQLGKSHNQASCLKCHTTGFDTGSGKFMSEGVTCEACHGSYKEGHPAKATMQLPMASDACRMCHLSTFEQWEKSKHGEKKIECFDCHMAHTQGLRTGSQETLCSACHATRETEFAHATHGISGLDCASCHMSQPKTAVADGMQAPARNHDFSVASDVCAGCHQDTIHTAAKLPALRQTVVDLDTQKLQAKAARVDTLEAENVDLGKRLASLRNVAVVSMGMALAVGGFLGVIGGIAGMVVWSRHNANKGRRMS